MRSTTQRTDANYLVAPFAAPSASQRPLPPQHSCFLFSLSLSLCLSYCLSPYTHMDREGQRHAGIWSSSNPSDTAIKDSLLWFTKACVLYWRNSPHGEAAKGETVQGAKRQRVLDSRGVGIFVTSTLIFALSPVSSFAQMPFYACTQTAGGNEESRVSRGGGGCRE